MSLFARARASSAWTAGFALDRATLEDFESRVVRGINAIDGGTYAPSSPLSIAGGGGNAATISGPVKICYGAVLATGTGARVAFGGADFPKLDSAHVGRARTIVTSCADAVSAPANALIPQFPAGSPRATALRFLVARSPVAVRWLLPLRTHHGATLRTATITYRAAAGRPRARLLRFDSGGTATPLTLTSGGADVFGWVPLAAPDATIPIQTALLLFDAGVVADRAAFHYALQVEEDQTLSDAAPNTLLVKDPVLAASTVNVSPLSGSPVIDGVPTNAGDRILLRAQTDAAENGVYTIPSGGLGYFERADVATVNGVTDVVPDALPAGYLVPVLYGATFGSTLLQLTSGAVTRLGQRQTFAPVAPTGNTYLACAVAHANIADTRWQ